MKKTIVAMTAAAFFATGTLAAAPAFAASAKQPEMVPLPAVAVLPAILILGAKKNEKFKPAKPYGKNTRTSQ